ncbi:aminotransferase class I/II-fold pyridoxal phosphate-dependent enzyme [Candidatus Uhrbacteria bacterium]|nr:aminotransferase class I/II-fold pyridoxal phosphate-dependent enzyme [Candidatus Uhrbacteria bacterium]
MIEQETASIGFGSGYGKLLKQRGLNRLQEAPDATIHREIAAITARVLRTCGAVLTGDTEDQLEATKPFDMYSMISSCLYRLSIAAMPSQSRDLVDRGHDEIQTMKDALASILRHDVLNLPDHKVILSPNGSSANRLSLEIARELTKRSKVLVSHLGHVSIKQACRTLGMQIIELEYDVLDDKSLTKATTTALDQNKDIAALVLTTPDSRLGVIESVDDAVLQRCRELGIRVHVDAAYGGLWFSASSKGNPTMRHLLESPYADSITADPHKFVGVPNCGALFLRQPSDLQVLGDAEVPYFEAADESAFGTTQKPDGALTALFHLHELGKEGVRKRADDCFAKAKELEAMLAANGFSTITPVQSGIVPIRLNSSEQVDHVQKELERHGFQVSAIKIQPANLAPQFGVRVVITPRPYFTTEILQSFVEVLRQVKIDT